MEYDGASTHRLSYAPSHDSCEDLLKPTAADKTVATLDFQTLSRSIRRLIDWVERNDYAGYEPFDGLDSFLRPITLGNWLAERVLLQAFLLCPFHIRPLFGVQRKKAAQAMGYFARAHLKLWRATGDPSHRDSAVSCLEWLREHASRGYSGSCWGNSFDSSARPFQLPAEAPTIVWTSLIGQAFLDAYEAIGDPKYLEIARGITRFIVDDLPRETTSTGDCISYVTFTQVSLHNSNMLGAAFLSRTSKHTGDRVAMAVARSAILYSCSRQQQDGSWYYGEEDKYHWVDNWHTAYILDSLRQYIDSSTDHTWGQNLEKGYEFYRSSFFAPSGRPSYYADRPFVADIQAAAQSIETLVNFSERHPEALAIARQVCLWTISNMQHATGYFIYRKLSWKRVNIPMIHWGQSTMLYAMACLLNRL